MSFKDIVEAIYRLEDEDLLELIIMLNKSWETDSPDVDYPTAEEIRNYDATEFLGMLKDFVEEVARNKDVCASAWWKNN